MQRDDLKPKWDESPELREEIDRELRNWSVWSRGGRPELGYPSEQPFSKSPQQPGPPCDIAQAENTESSLILWRLLARDLDEDRRQHNVKLITAIKLHYLSDRAAHTKAKMLHVSRPTFYRMIEEARFRYWVISSA